jgi:hypothetical protein
LRESAAKCSTKALDPVKIANTGEEASREGLITQAQSKFQNQLVSQLREESANQATKPSQESIANTDSIIFQS